MATGPFGPALKIRLWFDRPWFSLGPGWAALAGALSAGNIRFSPDGLLPLLALWLLADPLLGSLWGLWVQQGWWPKIKQAHLPPPPARGLALPYARPDSPAGRLVTRLRQYWAWRQNSLSPEARAGLFTLAAGPVLALGVSFFLGPLVLALTFMAVLLVCGAGLFAPRLPAASRDLLASAVHFLLPWLMGMLLRPGFSLPAIALALCFWGVYLGGMGLYRHYRPAGALFNLGQAAAMGLLLALRLLPAAALLAILLPAQLLAKPGCRGPAEFVTRVQPFLVAGMLAAAILLGRTL